MAKISVIKDRIRQMSPAGFQILCDDYLSRIGYPDLVSSKPDKKNTIRY